jgi:hypothetical protein
MFAIDFAFRNDNTKEYAWLQAVQWLFVECWLLGAHSLSFFLRFVVVGGTPLREHSRNHELYVCIFAS